MIDTTPSSASVVAALRACGVRNAATPSASASTPVRAVDPEEKARKIKNTDSPDVAPKAAGPRRAVSR